MSGGSVLTVEVENPVPTQQNQNWQPTAQEPVAEVSHGPIEIPEYFIPTQTTSASNIASGPTRSNVRCSCPNCQNGINRTTNSGKRVHNCHIKKCGKTYTKTSHLRSHLRVHFGERPYECQYCDKAFTRSDERLRHVRIHTGEKNHQCGVCGKWFSRSDHLKTHEKTHENPRRRNRMTSAQNIPEVNIEVYVPTYVAAEAEEQQNDKWKNETLKNYFENFALDLEDEEQVEFNPIGADGLASITVNQEKEESLFDLLDQLY